jgi:hypothetical protein
MSAPVRLINTNGSEQFRFDTFEQALAEMAKYTEVPSDYAPGDEVGDSEDRIWMIEFLRSTQQAELYAQFITRFAGLSDDQLATVVAVLEMPVANLTEHERDGRYCW